VRQLINVNDPKSNACVYVCVYAVVAAYSKLLHMKDPGEGWLSSRCEAPWGSMNVMKSNQIKSRTLLRGPDVTRALFSATLPETVEQLARSVMTQPMRLTVGERNSASTTIAQRAGAYTRPLLSST